MAKLTAQDCIPPVCNVRVANFRQLTALGQTNPTILKNILRYWEAEYKCLCLDRDEAESQLAALQNDWLTQTEHNLLYLQITTHCKNTRDHATKELERISQIITTVTKMLDKTKPDPKPHLPFFRTTAQPPRTPSKALDP